MCLLALGSNLGELIIVGTSPAGLKTTSGPSTRIDQDELRGPTARPLRGLHQPSADGLQQLEALRAELDGSPIALDELIEATERDSH